MYVKESKKETCLVESIWEDGLKNVEIVRTENIRPGPFSIRQFYSHLSLVLLTFYNPNQRLIVVIQMG